jgi:hypothetical protein
MGFFGKADVVKSGQGGVLRVNEKNFPEEKNCRDVFGLLALQE